jgi:cytochrome c-type biogenesis protein CcmH/NrfF
MRRLLMVILLALAAPAAAQRPEPGSPAWQTARAAMMELRSPVTPSHTLDMCPSAEAQRDTMYLAAATGLSREQLVEDFIARYGEQVRLLPRKQGFGWWAWLATPAVLLLGLGLVARKIAALRGRADPATRPLTDEERAQLETALRGLDSEEARV